MSEAVQFEQGWQMPEQLWRILDIAADLNDKTDIMITSPRRAGKTSFLNNLVEQLIKQIPLSDILLIAPSKSHSLERLKVHTTRGTLVGRDPKVILVEEAAYIKEDILRLIDIMRLPKDYIKTVYVGTPRVVTYTLEDNKWVNKDCYFKELWDYSPARKYSLSIQDYFCDWNLLTEKRYYTEDVWQTERMGNWVVTLVAK